MPVSPELRLATMRVRMRNDSRRQAHPRPIRPCTSVALRFFTEDDLDFIVNYDVKYRMGGVAEDEEE